MRSTSAVHADRCRARAGQPHELRPDGLRGQAIARPAHHLFFSEHLGEIVDLPLGAAVDTIEDGRAQRRAVARPRIRAHGPIPLIETASIRSPARADITSLVSAQKSPHQTPSGSCSNQPGRGDERWRAGALRKRGLSHRRSRRPPCCLPCRCRRPGTSRRPGERGLAGAAWWRRGRSGIGPDSGIGNPVGARASRSPYRTASSSKSPSSVMIRSSSVTSATRTSARCPNFELSARATRVRATASIIRLRGISRVLVLVIPVLISIASTPRNVQSTRRASTNATARSPNRV